jgi:multicomponent Na+:H+ antiporter subunit E
MRRRRRERTSATTGWRRSANVAKQRDPRNGGLARSARTKNARGSPEVLHAVGLAITMSVLWLLLSGHFTEPLLLGLGLASVVFVVAIIHRMDVLDHETHPLHLSLRLPLYWAWLIKEIVLANIDVAKAILGFRGAVPRPTVFQVRSSQRTEVGRVIYANSITLTPGTVTMAVEDDLLTIHALTPGAVEGLQSGAMDRRVSAVEER